MAINRELCEEAIRQFLNEISVGWAARKIRVKIYD